MTGTSSTISRGSTVQLIAETVPFTGNGPFDPAAYPGLQYVRVRCQAGGGGSTGAGPNPGPVGSPWVSIGIAGSGGGYSESLLTAAELGAAPIPVTVGAGGVGSAVGVSAGDGGDSRFGSLVVAKGGLGGFVLVTPSPSTWNDARTRMARNGAPTVGAVGDLMLRGSAGSPGIAVGGSVFLPSQNGAGQQIGTRLAVGGNGGASHLGGAAAGGQSSTGRGDEPTYGGDAISYPYGGGAPAPASAAGSGVGAGTPSPAVPGRNGGAGIVIVEVYRVVVS